MARHPWPARHPRPFSRTTVRQLWTDPHVSAEMLRYHLDPAVDLSSRNAAFIERSVAWIVREFRLRPGSRVLDLGCGPGLYAYRLAASGADVTGVDFSERSIAYAREDAARRGLRVTYACADYRSWEPAGTFDLALLIFCDYCAMGPADRRRLARKVARALRPDGAFMFDVVATPALRGRVDAVSDETMPNGGFWSASAYDEHLERLVYQDEAVSLDRYRIVEAAAAADSAGRSRRPSRRRSRTIYNWLQHFDPPRLAAELNAAGFDMAAVLGDVAGGPYDPDATEFAVVARPRGAAPRPAMIG